MRIPPIDPHNSPFHPAQVEDWNRFVTTISSDQTAWLLGYLSAINQRETGIPPQVVPPTTTRETSLTVLYASQTGNAAKVATQLMEATKAAGLSAMAISTADFQIHRLKSLTDLVLIASTQGQGDPPDSAVEFQRFIHGSRAPRLPNLRFSVLALGDSSYTHYCKVGADFDSRFEALGATRLVPRVDCDVEYESAANEWISAVVKAWKQTPGPAVEGAIIPTNQTPTTAAVWNKKNPFSARVLERINLNGRGSEKSTLHLELSLSGSGITYQPGDSLGIVPRNDPAYVDEFLAAARLTPEATVTLNDEDRPLRETLIELFEVTTITRPFLKAYAAIAGHEALTTLASPGHDETFRNFVCGREIIDVVFAYPPNHLTPQSLIGMLRRLQPRLYSIASSLLTHEEEVHLTVGVTRYEAHGRNRHGVCSTYLGDRLGEAEPVRVYLSPNPTFRLPADPNTPVLMIGPGTGIAPFRAFVEEREALGATGKNWLFFGDQHFTTDFLYQTEWQRWLKAGTLTRMDVAFSRDQPQKIYVQHRLNEKSRDVYAWLEEGAVIYVCGDAQHMAADVYETLISIISKEGGKPRDAAMEYMQALHKAKRYQRDVY
jgi:sulfite reductase (NADPH) flavoprotein alpha-component